MLNRGCYATVLITPSSPKYMTAVELATPLTLSDRADCCQGFQAMARLTGRSKSNLWLGIAATEVLAMLSQLLYADALVCLIPFYHRRRKQLCRNRVQGDD